MPESEIIIIGAGPAGMGCAYTLTQAGKTPLVIEKNDVAGGLCRTINFQGYLFDIGGHRFLSKSEEVNTLWKTLMNGSMVKVKRLSRIYYRKKYIRYPFSCGDTFFNLGPIMSFLCLVSYLKSKFLKPREEKTFQDWAVRRFGKRLFEIFFKPYTEKVWSRACSDISSDWAKQRIKGLSMRKAIQDMLLINDKKRPKTLYREFLYPKEGSGEFYRQLEKRITPQGAHFIFEKTLTRINHDREKIISIEITDKDNRKETLPVGYLFSSIPLPKLIELLEPKPPEEISIMSRKLEFRSLITVNIILDKENIFPDQWLYIHSPQVKVGRIQNYKNWSRDMVTDYRKTSLCLEYFCTEGDALWKMQDKDLIYFAVKELEKLGIITQCYPLDGFVLRSPDAYPVYTLDYKDKLRMARDYLSRFSNFQTMGRAGLFRYDNSDQALLSGIYAAKTFLGIRKCEPWQTNIECEYMESW